MPAKFRINEVVRIIAEPPRIRQSLINKEGLIVGMSDADDKNCHDYGVHVNEYGETFAIPEHALESTGRMGNPEDYLSRSRARGKRR